MTNSSLPDAELRRLRIDDRVPLPRPGDAVDADLAPARAGVVRRALVDLEPCLARELNVQRLRA